MNAYVLIRDNPYMAVSAADGSFEIANVSAGKRDLAFWHEGQGEPEGPEGRQRQG